MSESPSLTVHRTLTAGPLLRRGAVAPYRAVAVGGGEPHLVRTEMTGSAGLDIHQGRHRALASIAHLTDLQLADVQSPARFEFFNREFGDPRFRALVPVQRPQEAMTSHVVDAMVRTINRIPAGPVSGRPLELVVTSGDAIDNAQWNELTAFLTLLDGGLASVDSGGALFEGVQAPAWPDDIFWKPDGAVGTPDVFVRDFGFPEMHGLLAQALRPLHAAGLTVPWLGCYGNHEALVQGLGVMTPAMADALVGGVKPLRLADDVDRDTAVETFVHGAEAFFAGPHVAITSDPARRPVSRGEFVEAHLRPGAQPEGHGFTMENRFSNTAHYVFDTPAVRYIALDTASSAGGSDGRLDAAQLVWLERRLEEVHCEYRGRDGGIARTGHEDRLVVVFSHHGADTLTNTRGANHPAGWSGAAEVLALLHRFDNVVLWLNGHTHSSQVTARPDPHGVGGGFWEVTTCSIVDWPCQARLIELLDLRDGMLAIACTMLDHDSPVEAVGAVAAVNLAALHRELAGNVPWAGFGWRGAGTVSDRNVILPLRAPFSLGQLQPG